MAIRQVAVIGSGVMGAAIAACCLSKGLPVILLDAQPQALQAGRKRIDDIFASWIKRGLAEIDAEKQKAQLKCTENYADLASVDLAIEAASENIDVKKSIFQSLSKHLPAGAILATNTSSLSITQIASFTTCPERVVGLHFFNPAHIMKLVEVIAGLKTTTATIAEAIAFGQHLGKLAVRVEECASFLVNRLLGRYMNESLWCLQQGIAIEEIDRLACEYNMPIGPLALRDMNGADIGLAVAKFNYEEYGERFCPVPILQQMVDKNLLGQKTGRGFYLYDVETKKRTVPNPEIAELAKSHAASSSKVIFKAERLFLPMINEAFLVLQERICAIADLDPALKAGLGMRKGPLQLAEEMGLANCLNEIETLFKTEGERFRPAPLLKRYVWSGENTILK